MSMLCDMHSLHSDFHMFVETGFWEWKNNNLCRISLWWKSCFDGNPESGSNLHFRRCSIAGKAQVGKQHQPENLAELLLHIVSRHGSKGFIQKLQVPSFVSS